MFQLTLFFSAFSTVAVSSATSVLSSDSEFLSSSLQALRLATAEAVRDREVLLLRPLTLLGELLRENLTINRDNTQ